MTPLPLTTSGTTPEPNFLTAALRSWLVNHLLSQEDLEELVYLLLELGYEEASLPEAAPAPLRSFLKREMSRLASESSSTSHQLLIRICEGIVQFYLLHQGRETPALDQLNLFLPPGLSFSPVTGHLLFEPEDYFQPHNLFVQEQSSWLLSQGAFSEIPVQPKALGNGSSGSGKHEASDHQNSPDDALQKETSERPHQTTSETTPEPAQTAPQETAGAPETQSSLPPTRSSEFRNIRQRRLQLLKNMGE